MLTSIRIKVLLHQSRQKDGTHRVIVCVTKKGKQVTIDAGFTLEPKYWNEKGNVDRANWVRRSKPDFEELNRQLNILTLRVLCASRAHPFLTPAQVHEYLLSHPDESLEDLCLKGNEASEICVLFSKSPKLLDHYQWMMSRFYQVQLEMDSLKAELTKILTAQKGYMGYLAGQDYSTSGSSSENEASLTASSKPKQKAPAQRARRF